MKDLNWFGMRFVGVMTTMITAGAIIYCADQLASTTGLREIFFWSGIILLFLPEFSRALVLTFKRDEEEKEW